MSRRVDLSCNAWFTEFQSTPVTERVLSSCSRSENFNVLEGYTVKYTPSGVNSKLRNRFVFLYSRSLKPDISVPLVYPLFCKYNFSFSEPFPALVPSKRNHIIQTGSFFSCLGALLTVKLLLCATVKHVILKAPLPDQFPSELSLHNSTKQLPAFLFLEVSQ